MPPFHLSDALSIPNFVAAREAEMLSCSSPAILFLSDSWAVRHWRQKTGPGFPIHGVSLQAVCAGQFQPGDFERLLTARRFVREPVSRVRHEPFLELPRPAAFR